MLHYNIVYHNILYHDIFYYIMLYHIISYYIILYYIILYHIMLYIYYNLTRLLHKFICMYKSTLICGYVCSHYFTMYLTLTNVGKELHVGRGNLHVSHCHFDSSEANLSIELSIISLIEIRANHDRYMEIHRNTMFLGDLCVPHDEVFMVSWFSSEPRWIPWDDQSGSAQRSEAEIDPAGTSAHPDWSRLIPTCVARRWTMSN